MSLSHPQPSGPATHPVAVFLNYASEDRELAVWLRNLLLARGATSVWLDRKEIEGGDLWKKEIDDGLWRSQVAVSILTRTSSDPSREVIRYEQERALALLKKVIPCLFEEEKAYVADRLLPEHFRAINFIPFADRERGFLDLLDSIGKSMPRFGAEFQNQAKAIRHSFVGREHDLKALKSHIDEGPSGTGARSGPIAIQGLGGLGKTMLAEELVRRLAFHYPGGTLIEVLAGQHVGARLVRQRWVEWALGALPNREYDENEVRSLLFTRYGQMLLLLDDVDENEVDSAREILDAMPVDSVRIVTTRSETVCKLLGAVTYRLAPLIHDDAMTLLRTRLEEHFASRTGASDGAERGAGAVADAVTRHQAALETLIEKVDSHPLALDLAIGTCDYLDQIPERVEFLVESLKQGIDQFGVAIEAAGKNDSLALSLQISLRELERIDPEPPSRGLSGWLDRVRGRAPEGGQLTRRFRSLGIFPDGSIIPREMLLAVWDADGVGSTKAVQMASSLTRRAMLKVDSSSRYSTHPVVRAFATGLLRQHPEEYQAVGRRYVAHVIERASEEFGRPQEDWGAARLLLPHMQTVASLVREALGSSPEQFDEVGRPDIADAKALRRLKRADKADLRRGVALAHAVEEFVIRRPEWGEAGRRCLRLGLACARALGSVPDEVEFLKRLGGSLSRSSPSLAGEYFTRALDLARRTGDEAQEGSVLSYYGELERTGGNAQHALELLAAALRIHRARADHLMAGKTLKYAGEVYWRKGLHEEALEHYRLAMEIYERQGIVSGKADVLNKIGSVEFNRGNHRRAIELFQQALELHRAVGDRSMEGEDLNDMGAAHRYLGELEQAGKCFREALKIHMHLGNRRLESIARANLAGTLWAQGVHERAQREAADALAIANEANAPIPAIWALSWGGLALQSLGEIDEAEEMLCEAVERARRVDNPRGQAGALGNLAVLLLEHRNRPAEAAELLTEAVRLMTDKKLDQAFGGRRLDELERLLETAEGRVG